MPDGDIWSKYITQDPGDLSQFDAAACFLEATRRQQRSNYQPKWKVEKQASDHVVNVFLDRLALLFARIKTTKGAPKNVTATGLIVSEGSHNGDHGTRSVFIAKNTGLSMAEKKFAEQLVSWLNDEHSCLDDPLSQDNRAWIAITEFWTGRIQYYVNAANKAPSALAGIGLLSISEVEWDDNVLSKGVVDEIRTRNLGTKEHLDALWSKESQARQLLLHWWVMALNIGVCLLQDLTTDASFPPPQLLLDFSERCRQLRSFRDTNLVEVDPTMLFSVPQENGSMQKSLSKLVSSLEHIGQPHAMWHAMACFRKDCQQKRYRVSIQPLDCPTLTVLLKQSILETFSTWANIWDREDTKERQAYRADILARPQDDPLRLYSSDDFLDRLAEQTDVAGTHEVFKQAVDTVKKSKDTYRYVHCEIQMLTHLTCTKTVGRKHYYIGCSKLSCEVCWRILRNRDYRTDDSHHKISANCGFPIKSHPDMSFLSDILEELRDEWMVTITKILNGEWEDLVPGVPDTQPMATQARATKVVIIKPVDLNPPGTQPRLEGPPKFV